MTTWPTTSDLFFWDFTLNLHWDSIDLLAAAAIEELASSIESSVTASVGEKMETYLEELKAEAQVGGADSVTTEELTAAIVAKLEDAMATGEIQLPAVGGIGQSRMILN